MRTYRVNRPTASKGRSAGSNVRVVCSTLLCAMPIYGRGSRFAEARSASRLCQRTDFVHARHSFYAGVKPAHTRICSILSCDVFARVVSIKPWGETDLNFLLDLFIALTCHAIFPATQSRMRKEFKRGKPSSFCPFRTFRTSEKYLLLIVTFRTSEKNRLKFSRLSFHIFFSG